MLCFPIPNSTCEFQRRLVKYSNYGATKSVKMRLLWHGMRQFWGRRTATITFTDLWVQTCAHPPTKKDLDPDALHFTFTSGARPSAPAKSVKCSLRLHATLQRWLHSRLTRWILRLCLQFSPCGALSIHKLRNAAACFSCRSSDPLPVTRCRILCR